ncbi:heme-binding domain-containing protein [Winogradskyella sp. PG-2]|uniref:heme-binding domain-containing protein n=1 Tax=Winogradskyella sp. PG-2 TaxID=754409 RepID=UPI0004586D24|nr:heme-binding domain-containing protein [Winogradskyella sp. PG-2]BAO74283.1 hypothetical protein WPG_0053 [Winogradskyella sp. PG-2]
MMKIFEKILIVLLIALILIQFYRPEKNNAENRDVAVFESQTEMPAKVKAVFSSKCYDCHSNKTTYPWYSEVAPVSFFIADHVEEGIEHFNVSQWESYSIKKKDHKLDELIEEIEANEMPLKSYNLLHGGITESEKVALIAWARKVRKTYNIN